jgi:hypothetical protein
MRDFVGRSEQLATITTALRAPHGGLVIVDGESGSGRTALLHEAGRLVRSGGVLPVLISWGAAGPTETVIAPEPDTIRECAERHRGRVVFLLDDAHLAVHDTVRLLRDLHRGTGAGLLVSHQPGAAPIPDPVDCLRYEPDVRFVTLAGLDDDEVGDLLNRTTGADVDPGTAASLRLATGGNPQALAALLAAADLLAAAPDGRALRLDRRPTAAIALSGAHRDRLVDALRSAWSDLNLDRLDDLCVLAARTGSAADAAPAQAFVCLLRGQVREGLAKLRGHPAPHAVLARALLLTLGAGAVDEADRLLRSAVTTGKNSWLTAARAFLFAAVGRTTDAARVLAEVTTGDDRRTQLFSRAAAARIDLLPEPRRAIPHLRRALIAADVLHDELPWLRPLLTGMLIDALLLAGRINEATETTAVLHAERQGAGWDIAVTLARLIENARLIVNVRARGTGGRPSAEPLRWR